MNDEEIIADAYSDAVQGLFKILMSSYVMAGGNPMLEKQADQAFKAGLAVTRKVRDQALVLLK